MRIVKPILFFLTCTVQFTASAQPDLAPPVELRRDGVIHGIEYADMDGDGAQDLVGLNWGRIVWCRNLGGGTFSSPLTFAEPAPSTSIFTGYYVLIMDVDEDGDLDVVPQGVQRLEAWLNDGTGHCNGLLVIDTEISGHLDIGTADLDNNGHVDLYCNLYNGVAWFANLGSGTWGPANMVYLYQNYADRPNTTDMDSDGDQDFLIYDEATFTTGWWENDGTGQFTFVGDLCMQEFVLPYPGDVDSDGDLDLMGHGLQGFKWLERTGPSTFDPVPHTSDPDGMGAIWHFDLHDIDLDGDMDVYTGNCILRNVGGGQYEAVLPSGPFVHHSMHLFDADDDGDADWFGSLDHYALPGDSALCWIENQAGEFSAPQSDYHLLTPHYNGSANILIGDLNGDGWKDVICDDGIPGSPLKFMNLGAGQFDNGTRMPADREMRMFQLADLDTDGDLDLVTASWDPQVIAFELNDGTGTFGPRTVLVEDSVLYNIEVCDVDQNGFPDILVGGYPTPAWALLNAGNAVFSPPSELPMDGADLQRIYCYRPEADTVTIISSTGSAWAASYVLHAGTDLSYASLSLINPSVQLRDGNLLFYVSNSYLRYSRYEPGHPPGEGFVDQFVPIGSIDGTPHAGDFFLDIDGDGDQDLMWPHLDDNGWTSMQYLERTGELSFGPADTLIRGSGHQMGAYAAADINHIGTDDIVYNQGPTLFLQPVDEVLSTGVSSPDHQPFVEVFPTPATDHALVRLPRSGEVPNSWALLDITGRRVRTLPPGRDGLLRVERGGLPSGVYTLQAQCSSGRGLVARIIFQ